MAITNGSFETETTDTPSWPDGWTAYLITGLWDFYQFGAPYTVPESFEYGHSSNEDSLDEFALTDLTSMLFGTDLDSMDDFEDQWSNEPRYTEWPSDADAAFDLAGDTHEDFEEEWPSRHLEIDDRSVTYDPIATSLSDAVTRTRINALKATYEAHRVDTNKHTAADTSNVIGSPDATDLSSTTTLVNEMWTDCWAHILDGSDLWHLDVPIREAKPTLGDYPAASYSNARDLLLLLEIHLSLHLTWADNSGAGYAEQLIDGSSWTTADGLCEIAVSKEFDVSVMEEMEDFEEEWDSNEDSLAAFNPATDLDDFDFFEDAGPLAYEDFETTKDLSFPGVSSTPGASVSISPSLPSQIEIGGTFSGTAYVQTRNKGSATWVTRSTITTTSVTVELDAGYEAARIYTDTYTSGTPTAVLRFLEA